MANKFKTGINPNPLKRDYNQDSAIRKLLPLI